MRVALYTRVSTREQHLDNQLHVLRAWCTDQGYEIVSEFRDIVSGVKRRGQLDDLMAAARGREFDLGAIWSLDRLTREGTFQSLYYLTSLTSMGIKVFSHQQPMLNPGQPFYDVVVAVYAEVARLERLQISERTKAGLARARRNGKQLGRPPGSKDHQPRRKLGYYARYAK